MDGSLNMNSIRLVLVHALVDRRFPLANGGMFSVAFLFACVQTSPISFVAAEKGRLRNAVANRVPASR